MRRFAHYDYWSDSVRQSILADAPADLLVYGMGEKPLREVALRLEKGERIEEIRDIAGTTVKEEIGSWRNAPRSDCLVIPGFIDVSRDKRKYAEAFAMHYGEQDPFRGRTVVQPHPKTVIIQNRPALPLTAEELDHIYELPFTERLIPLTGNPFPPWSRSSFPSPATEDVSDPAHFVP